MIETERLTLIPLTCAELELCLDNSTALEAQIGLRLARSLLTDVVDRAMRIKIEKMSHAAEHDHPWYTYWLIVVRGEQMGVGMAGFKGAPSLIGTYDGAGEVEIGYGIAPEFGGKGYMTEAVRALITWAFAQPDCYAIIAAEVLKTNTPSIRVLQKVGMTVYRETPSTLFWRIRRGSEGSSTP